MAQKLRHFDGFHPVAVLLVDAHQVLARLTRHIAAQQFQKNLFRSVNQACALIILRQFEQYPLPFVVHRIRRIEQRAVHIDGFVVFPALAVEFAQRQVQIVRLRLLVDHFGQFARRAAAVAVDQRVKAFIEPRRHAFGLFQHCFHIDAGGEPAHRKKHGQQDNRQQDDPDFVLHIIP